MIIFVIQLYLLNFINFLMHYKQLKRKILLKNINIRDISKKEEYIYNLLNSFKTLRCDDIVLTGGMYATPHYGFFDNENYLVYYYYQFSNSAESIFCISYKLFKTNIKKYKVEDYQIKKLVKEFLETELKFENVKVHFHSLRKNQYHLRHVFHFMNKK